MASGGTAARSLPKRLSTGIAGLDTVLGGGLFEGDLYVTHGLPGTGKTTLANQISFHQARSGRQVVCATLLGESHDRMLLAEHRSRLVRLLSILKVRQSGFDPAVMPFEIGRQGITLREPLPDAEEAAAPGAAAVRRDSGGGVDRTV